MQRNGNLNSQPNGRAQSGTPSPSPTTSGLIATDETGATQFLCRAHLAELGQICCLRPADGQAGRPGFDYFSLYPYGYLY